MGVGEGGWGKNGEEWVGVLPKLLICGGGGKGVNMEMWGE